MIPNINKYVPLFSCKTGLCIGIAMGLASMLQAQSKPEGSNNYGYTPNPSLLSSFKKPVKPVAGINERFKRPTNQLMSWPNYPLTAQQIMQRDRKYDQPIGKQILDEMAESYINSLLNGRNKKPVAVRPRF